MCVLSIKVPIRKMSCNVFNDPRICVNMMSFAILRLKFRKDKMIFLRNYLLSLQFVFFIKILLYSFSLEIYGFRF